MMKLKRTFSKPYFIAEVSSNHNQSLTRCLDFVDVAADIGCDAVKFQLFKIEQLFCKEVVDSREEIRSRKKWELPIEFLPKIKNRCLEKNIDLGVTPFFLDAVNILEPIVDFFKIASYELLWDDILIKCATTGKELILSTGMANMKEITHAVNVLSRENCNRFSLLHCTSAYPTPKDECNLAAIKTLRDSFKCDIGWSDHSANPGVVLRAIHKWDASIIEFHLDLDRKGDEYKSGHCWLPDVMKNVISNSKNFDQTDGSGDKKPCKSENPDREWRADPSDGLRPLMKTRRNIKI